MADRPERRTLERALAWWRETRAAGRRREEHMSVRAPMPEPTFRAVIDERLRGLERQLDEVKGRVNGLLFLLAGAVASQIVLRLLG